MYRKLVTGAPARHVWCKSRAGCLPRCRRAAAASASCPRTSWPHSVRLEATPRPTIITLLLPAHTMTLRAATATDCVRIRRLTSTGTFVQLHDLLFSRNHARATANGRPGAFRVDCLCLARCSSVPALAGSLDFQGCVHALHESAHGPRHVF